MAVPTLESSHDRVRAIDSIGGDLSIRFDLIGLVGRFAPVLLKENKLRQ